MLNYSIASRSSDNPFYCISFFSYAFNHDSSPYLSNTHFFFSSNYKPFLRKTYRVAPIPFFRVVADLHPAQILRPQHMIALKMPTVYSRLICSSFFFSDLAMSRPRPRLGNNHIGNLLPLEMCSLFSENDHSNKSHLH